ncbi:30S ribosomal protein S9 [Candidatus Woesebacteria bacterium RIFCSPLOWO2_01_FULL_39_23]|uniref:30S ribosomal protein S9 n=2 Tax=Microgenomates group TaxID=1794810 RepID=A0A0H4T6K5_9BACT|nr:30S ribosomal protein S9, small subunit ribosomal protein S9 [uncultured Microgenomates bacterium Rifle_16ft_4_minimus_37633]OGM13900.1 MAG: 30S ribosomal protein S9 [Candidatus Woesebacteria bacterium RBG_16_40_11]OGM27852.1 MAG: 30S ribosomal protein S9 [Candidatus Woesebacteria bacterium RIFCSPHIGHO2_01_FULL_40_22]OGM36314.1 MAG: 30S ribosomal protein S9 [Candidatus Woesebacteria bacterium RIFCSPHIGHO2_12_FULL_38_9]OGM62274.1 MAG: 30S ribosomal protein S9 [Candidatus Woesebacteria bacteri
MKKKKTDYIFAKGRRKSASSRVRLYKGKGESTVNGKTVDEYFPGVVGKNAWTNPFKLVDVEDKYYVSVKVKGGGKNGQLDAVVHGIARALSLADRENFRPALKKAKILTRDPRVRERRKIGTGGKARRKKQSPKR